MMRGGFLTGPGDQINTGPLLGLLPRQRRSSACYSASLPGSSGHRRQERIQFYSATFLRSARSGFDRRHRDRYASILRVV